VIFAAYAVRAATGFGSGVVAIPLLLLTLPFPVTIAVVTATGMLASLGQSIREARHVDWRAIARLVAPILAGVALGLALFAVLDPQVLLKAFALFIIGYALWSLGPAQVRAGRQKALALAGGATGGLVATLFGGMAGPFIVMYLNALGLDKARFRATISALLFALAAVRILGYGGLGFYGRDALALLGVSLPLMVLAMFAGDALHRGLDETWFKRVVAGLLVLSGAALLFK
jgi:uncharacterized membrane protein YfcA